MAYLPPPFLCFLVIVWSPNTFRSLNRNAQNHELNPLGPTPNQHSKKSNKIRKKRREIAQKQVRKKDQYYNQPFDFLVNATALLFLSNSEDNLFYTITQIIRRQKQKSFFFSVVGLFSQFD